MSELAPQNPGPHSLRDPNAHISLHSAPLETVQDDDDNFDSPPPDQDHTTLPPPPQDLPHTPDLPSFAAAGDSDSRPDDAIIEKMYLKVLESLMMPAATILQLVDSQTIEKKWKMIGMHGKQVRPQRVTVHRRMARTRSLTRFAPCSWPMLTFSSS